MTQIPDKLYFKIGEVARITQVKPYVLRYWESEFKLISPQKSKTNQRIYTKKDVELILEIKRLLYKERYTLEGAKKKIREFKSKKKEQLSFPFKDKNYQQTLLSIRNELNSIRNILIGT